MIFGALRVFSMDCYIQVTQVVAITTQVEIDRIQIWLPRKGSASESYPPERSDMDPYPYIHIWQKQIWSILILNFCLSILYRNSRKHTIINDLKLTASIRSKAVLTGLHCFKWGNSLQCVERSLLPQAKISSTTHVQLLQWLHGIQPHGNGIHVQVHGIHYTW